MSIDKDIKKDLITKFGNKENDTGSSKVQIALFSERIKYLTEHLKKHNHDHHTRKGLMIMVGKRKRLLNYLQKKDNKQYKEIIKELEIRN